MGNNSSNLSETRISTDTNGYDKCQSCRKLEHLISWWTDPTPGCNAGRTGRTSSRPQLLHNSFSELDACSRYCISCRVFRRAFILEQPTFQDIAVLRSTSIVNSAGGQHPNQVWAVLRGDPGLGYTGNGLVMTLFLADGNGAHTEGGYNKAEIRLSFPTAALSGPGPRRLSPTTACDSVYRQLRAWASDCHNHHTECSNLEWSRNLPSRLLEIAPDGLAVQVVKVSPDHARTTRYTALSYCWGATNSAATTPENLDQRQAQPFPIRELPKTIRDAITLTFKTGVEYIWVDSLCIVQGSPGNEDFVREAPRMHEVYSNAYFTICALAGTHADTDLFQMREAWRYPTERSYLKRWCLQIQVRPLQQLKSLATWSTRGWTMQEELLSPRTVYCGPSRVYWSCCQAQLAERVGGDGSQAAQAALMEVGPVDSSADHSTQGFLQAARSGKDLQSHWMATVESYSTRNLSDTTDRFTALSGLAARYQTRRPHDMYLAGLWYDNLAQGLSWQVLTGVPPELSSSSSDNKLTSCPTWSWASLPIPTPVRMDRADWHEGTTARVKILSPHKSLQGEPLGDDVVDRVTEDAATKSIVVRARLRPLCRPTSRLVPWSSLLTTDEQQQPPTSYASGTHGNERNSDAKNKKHSIDKIHSPKGEAPQLSFRETLGEDAHSIDDKTGMIVVYQPRMPEILGQLDYLESVPEVYARPWEVICLEIAANIMLLVVECSSLDNDEQQHQHRHHHHHHHHPVFAGDGHQANRGIAEFRRVGISRHFRDDFFLDAKEADVKLV